MEKKEMYWWDNPCDVTKQEEKPFTILDWNIREMWDPVRSALVEMNTLLDQWVQVSFIHGESADSYNERILYWQADLPKKYHEQVSNRYLDSKLPEYILREIYNYLQLSAVAIDLVIEDARPKSNTFFRVQKETIKPLLCTLRSFLVDTVKTSLPPDVTSDILPYRAKAAYQWSVPVRDYIIFKEFLNLLEYYDQTLAFYENQQRAFQKYKDLQEVQQ